MQAVQYDELLKTLSLILLKREVEFYVHTDNSVLQQKSYQNLMSSGQLTLKLNRISACMC